MIQNKATVKSGFKAATITVKSAHSGYDWIWGGLVIERFQHPKHICSRNSLLVQFLCYFIKLSSLHTQYITETKQTNKKTTIMTEDVLSYKMLSTVAEKKQKKQTTL